MALSAEQKKAIALANARKRQALQQSSTVASTQAQVTEWADSERQSGVGIDESLMTVGSSVLAEPIAGLAGIVQTLNPFADPGAGARAVEATREALTYIPRTEEGLSTLQSVGEFVEPAGEVFSALEDTLGDVTYELTGSPSMAAAAKSSPTLLLELLGLRAIGGLKKGQVLIDDSGRPTKALKKALNKQGLDFDNLTDAARQAIPEKFDPSLMPVRQSIKDSAEAALVQQIKSGGGDDALAGFKVVGNRLAPDNVAAEVVRQGFEPGMVQTIKNSSKATKGKMQEMLTNMRRISKESGLADDLRPSNVAGDSLLARARFIRDKANSARKELDTIARNELVGKDINLQPILSTFTDAVEDLGVRLTDGPGGVPVPDFSQSVILKNISSQTAVKDAIDLMAQGGKPDAARLHILKRQLDELINYKKDTSGLSGAGEIALRRLRGSINDSLRVASDDYARVNDTLSKSLNAFDNLESAAGRSIDVFGEGGADAIGTRLRSLMSKQQNRVNLRNSVREIDSLAKELGGQFNDDVEVLTRFANHLDNRFGDVAETGLKAEIGSAIRREIPLNFREAGLQGVEKGVEKLRGVNDFNAFNAMEELLGK